MFFLKTGLLNDKAITVAVVGVGGTGSEVVSGLINLHLGLITLGYGGLNVVAFDPEIVSPANIVRQRYSPSDIGSPKATVLINRINMAYALGWQGIQSRFTGPYADRGWDLVISCVDTRKSRRELHRYAFKDRFGPWKFWLDCGNDKSTGQVVLGTPRGKSRVLKSSLPSATVLHPELMDKTLPDHDIPSCSAAESLNHQDLCVNKMVAVLAIDLLWRLFRDKQLKFHARYFDLETSSVACRAVPSPTRSVKNTSDFRAA